jgi:hypothetical protein
MADEMLVALISESVLAQSPERRKAAGLLLGLLRETDLHHLRDRMTALGVKASVAEQADQLIQRYRLDS